MKLKKIISLSLVSMLTLGALAGCGSSSSSNDSAATTTDSSTESSAAAETPTSSGGATTWTVTCPWAPSGVASLVSQKAASMSGISDEYILVAEAVQGDTATLNSWITSNGAEDPELVFVGEGMLSITSQLDPDKMLFSIDDLAYVENLYSAIFVMSADTGLGIENLVDLEAYMAEGNVITVGTNGAVSSEAFLAAALFGSMGYGDQMQLIPYASAAEAAQAVAKGETDLAISHQSQILETFNQGDVNMICAFDDGAIQEGPFAGLEGVGAAGYPYFRNRCFIFAPAGADEGDLAGLQSLYREVLADAEMGEWLANTMILEVDPMSEAEMLEHVESVANIVEEYKDILVQ
ncbi:MAG: hypothetical protein R3Y53_05985 [Bacillota bacterium]